MQFLPAKKDALREEIAAYVLEMAGTGAISTPVSKQRAWPN